MNKGNLKHGYHGHYLYKVYRSMIDRCYRKTAKDYHVYGGRGIDICKEWKDDVTSFVLWCLSNNHVKGMQIDRINNDLGYSPDNCRIVSAKQNARNRMYNRFYEGKTIGQWLEYHYGSYDQEQYRRFQKRLKSGWSLEKCIRFVGKNSIKKINSFTIEEIKKEFVNGMKISMISEKYKISKSRIYQFKNEFGWVVLRLEE